MDAADTLEELGAVVIGACHERGDWAAGVSAGIYAGIDFAIAHPEIAEVDPTSLESSEEFSRRYDSLIQGLTVALNEGAPAKHRRSASPDEALVAGVAGIVGDHLRLRRLDRLAALRPELVLVVLLPYLGFAEAQRWANLTSSTD